MLEEVKKRYAPPTLTVHGDVAEITKASLIGGHLDADYSAGTTTGPIFS